MELQQEGRWAVSSGRICRRLLPPHELPPCSPPVPPGCQRDWKPPLSLATDPSPAYGKACLCLTSFVINDVKCFQSLEYALSSAAQLPSGCRNGVIVKVLVEHELCISWLAAAWYFKGPTLSFYLFSVMPNLGEACAVWGPCWKMCILKQRNCSVERKHEYLTNSFCTSWFLLLEGLEH